tara:strand:- start:350 stop:586 length:237 start_codon:yes stop_codon:yes gene_type:complete
MPAGGTGIPPLQLSLASSADTGDNIITPDFQVDFGDKIAGKGASGSGPFDDLIGLGMNFLKLTAVALVSGYILKKVKL